VLNLGNAGHIFIGGGAGEIADDLSTYGKGVQSAISGTPQWYSGGGYRQDDTGNDYPARGIERGSGRLENAESGTGDGGGAGSVIAGTDGGSGIVIVRSPVTAQ
jgi:hypothetical protein